MTNVRVLRSDYSDWTSPRCTADMFEACVLTISSVDTGNIIQTFQPEQWRHVDVINHHGWTDFSFDNPALTAQQPHHHVEGAA